MLVLTPGHADADQFMKHYRLGRELVNASRYEEAIEPLRAALGIRPDHPEAHLLLGVALFETGNTQEAQTHLQAALREQPNDARTNFEMGRLQERLGLYDEAIDFYEQVIVLDPVGTWADRSRTRLNIDPKPYRPWSFTLSTGYQYDSNVVLVADDFSLPSDVSHKSDSRGVITLSANHRFIRWSLFNTGFEYTLYKSSHAELDTYDVFSHSGRFVLTSQTSHDTMLISAYSFGYTSLGETSYNDRHQFYQSLIIERPGGILLGITYVYASLLYENSTRFPENSLRNGDTNKFSFSVRKRAIEHTSGQLTYTFEFADAEAETYQYRGNLLQGEIEHTFSDILSLGLFSEYYVKDFGGTDSVQNTSRYDRLSTFSGTITRKFPNGVSLTLNHLVSATSSTIKRFRNKRTVTGIMLSVKW